MQSKPALICIALFKSPYGTPLTTGSQQSCKLPLIASVNNRNVTSRNFPLTAAETRSTFSWINCSHRSSMQSMCSMYAAFAWRSFSSSAIRSSIFFRSCTFDAIASCCAFCCSASRICSRSLSFSALACSSHADNSAFSSSMRCEIAACCAAKSGKSSICTGSGAFIAASCAALFVINFAISRKWSSSSAIRLLLLLA